MLEPEVRLRQAVIDGNLLVLKRLLRRFPDLLENIDPSNGWSSLHYAAFHGRYLICVHLISLGHDKDEVLRTFKGNTSVHLSLTGGHEQTTHLLLQHFPQELNARGANGVRPLQVCTISDYYQCLEMLIGLGCDVNAVDDEGNSALHLAMKYGSLQCIRLLVTNHINVDLKNKHGLRAIDVTASYQVESYYNSLVFGTPTEYTPDELSQDRSASSTSLKTQTGINSPSVQQSQQRTHSNSLPPLPSVTTARRSSNASSVTRSPIPRSAISMGFTGSNSNSYIYSPISTSHQISLQSHSPNISSSVSKPPPIQVNSLGSSSPVLYSPTTTNGLITSAIREESGFNLSSLSAATTSTGPPAPSSTTVVGTGLINSHSLSSFPSMSSLNSGRNTPMESRNRANSTIQSSVNFIPLNKSRSNSHGSKTSNTTANTGGLNINLSGHTSTNTKPGKISPVSSGMNLSRSTTSTSSNDEFFEEKFNSNNNDGRLSERSSMKEVPLSQHTSNSSLTKKSELNSPIMPGFNYDDNNELRKKYTKPAEEPTKERRSILSIPIASLGRGKRD